MDATAVLDGITITEGKADLEVFNAPDGKGGGLRAVSGSPTVRHTFFRSNDAVVEGGGAYLENSTSLISDCRFEANRSRNYLEGGNAGGGGVYIQGGNPYFADCAFHKNMCDGFGLGAGFVVWMGSATFVRPSITENMGSALDTAGGTLKLSKGYVVGNFVGIRLGGSAEISESIIVRNYGAGVSTQGGTLSLTNCLISGNLGGGNGAGLSVLGGVATIRTSTIVGNIANINGGGLYSSGTSNVAINNSVFWGNAAGAAGSAVFMRTLPGGFVPTVSISFSECV